MSMPRRVLPPVEVRDVDLGRGRGRLDRLDDSIRDVGASFDVELAWPPSLVIGLFALLMAGGGFVGGGLLGASVSLVALAGAGFVLRQTAAHRRSMAAQRALPDVSLRMARTVRSGRPIDTALVGVVGEVVAVPDGLATAARQVSSGRPVSKALLDWSANAESSAERVLSAAVVLGVLHGGDLAVALDAVGEGLRDDLDLAERRRVLLTQATMSATVLVLLPVVFAVLASMVRGASVFQGTLGVALVVGGLGLDAIGCLWMRMLMRGLR